MTHWENAPAEGVSRQALITEKAASLEKLAALLAELSKQGPEVRASQESSVGSASAALAHAAMIVAVQRACLQTEAALVELLKH